MGRALPRASGRIESEAPVKQIVALAHARGAGESPLGISTRSLHGQVANRIGAGILGGRFAPSAMLPNEADWSAQLGVSRTALREAIKLLSGKGLVESRPKTGTRVRPRERWNFLDPDVLAWQLAAGPADDFVRDLFELRRLIEEAAASFAARRASIADIEAIAAAYADMAAAGDDDARFIEPDLRFHRTILRAVGNEMLRALGAVVETALASSLRLSLDNPRGQRHSLPLHKAVLDAIHARAPARARRAMQRLIDHAEADVMSALALRRAGAENPARKKKRA
jgi:DNA-binding FadR family transcriptional regulator